MWGGVEVGYFWGYLNWFLFLKYEKSWYFIISWFNSVIKLSIALSKWLRSGVCVFNCRLDWLLLLTITSIIRESILDSWAAYLLFIIDLMTGVDKSGSSLSALELLLLIKNLSEAHHPRIVLHWAHAELSELGSVARALKQPLLRHNWLCSIHGFIAWIDYRWRVEVSLHAFPCLLRNQIAIQLLLLTGLFMHPRCSFCGNTVGSISLIDIKLLLLLSMVKAVKW